MTVQCSDLFFILFLVSVGQSDPIHSWRPDPKSGLLGPKVESASLNTSAWTVKEAAFAVERAEQVIGASWDEPNTVAELITLIDDDTPFLTQLLIERPMWQVTMSNSRPQLSSAPESTAGPARTWDVLVRPDDGVVIRARSRWPEGVKPMPPEPRAASATCQIYGSGYDVYHAFPTSNPRISLAEALDVLQKRGESVLEAKQISARYVVWSSIAFESPRPVWAITLRGVLPTHPAPGMEIEPIYEYRLIVDAQTGKFLCGSNRPLPEELNPPDRRYKEE